MVRINRFLSQAGLGSRRSVEQLVRDGRVLINGSPAELSSVVEAHDEVHVDGQAVTAAVTSSLWLYHKPVGIVTSFARQGSDRCLADVIPDELHRTRLFYVGRLDRDSSGLLLLTNDGDLGQRLQHPSGEIWKTYHVHVDGTPSADDLTALRNGSIALDGRPCAPARAELQANGSLEIELREGRNRQIRRMLAELGYTVTQLRRTAVGPLELGELEPGAWRAATDAELRGLVNLASASD